MHMSGRNETSPSPLLLFNYHAGQQPYQEHPQHDATRPAYYQNIAGEAIGRVGRGD